MPYHVDNAAFQRVEDKVRDFFENFKEDLELAGDAAAKSIVQETLAGLDENSSAYTPYSASYQKQLDAVGGKAQGVVTLRGIFEHSDATKGQRQSNRDRRNVKRGAGQRGHVTITVGGGKSFTARTAITRPQRGLTDTQSEMSLDLIHSIATDQSLKLEYRPRRAGYMRFHQNGEGRNPKRTWFCLRTGTKEALMSVIRTAIKARAAWFNSHQSGPPPSGGAAGASEAP